MPDEEEPYPLEYSRYPRSHAPANMGISDVSICLSVRARGSSAGRGSSPTPFVGSPMAKVCGDWVCTQLAKPDKELPIFYVYLVFIARKQ